MNYQETLDYLFSQLPMYQRIGKAAYKADLSNTIALCKVLGNPERNFKSVHVAGTNGKGSTSHMIASILHEAGYKVGLYTSPHLVDFRERVKINGAMIPEKNVVDFIRSYKGQFENIGLSFFEMTVGMAFDYFSKEKVDIAIIETGLGGRLDSTNVITPELSVITNISLDHTHFLGNTLEKIAKEKAGIIKQCTPLVIGETQEETKAVFIEKAHKLSAPILFADAQPLSSLSLSPNISYQKKNEQTTLVSINQLIKIGWAISDDAIKSGLSSVIKKTGLQGRWQTLQSNPIVICDTAHNDAGIKLILEEIPKMMYKKLHFVLGIVNDKNISQILSLLPTDAEYYFCKADIPRALNEIELHNAASQIGLNGTRFSNVFSAISAANKRADSDDLIFIGGSAFVVAEALQNNKELFGGGIK